MRRRPVHVTGNYAYDCNRMAGRAGRWSATPWTFVDPMFSSGVFLAMNHAEHAAEAIDQSLRAPAREAALMRALERRLTGGLREFKWFIYRFTSPTMKRLFAEPRNVLQVEQAVISMLAGDVFDARPVLWRLRVFRVIYALTTLRIAPEAARSWWQRRRDIRRGMRRHAAGGDAMNAAHPLASADAPRFAVDYVHAGNPAALLAEPACLPCSASATPHRRAIRIRATCTCRCNRMAARLPL